MIEKGLIHTSHTTVTDDNTAIALGSGDMSVLATPALIALMENAAMLAVAPHLPEGTTTVGGHIEASHLRPSAIGTAVEATAELSGKDGKKLYFKIVARQGHTIIGEATHLRFIVDREKFMANLTPGI